MNGADIERCRKRIVQYLWDPEPKNDEESNMSLWCLGIEYPPSKSETASLSRQSRGSLSDHELLTASEHVSVDGWPETFLLDFESRIWMTYRSNFPPIPKIDNQEANSSMTISVRLRSQLLDTQGFTSDTGWGCMIRSGQSLLANAMVILKLGRGWRRGGSSIEKETQLLSLFADSPDAPFSIHRFVKHGAEACGKYPGEWFGPSATARCIHALSAQHEPSALRVYLTDDTSDVYQDKFMNVARDELGVVQPTLILLGTRLGIDHVTPVYWDGLKAVLQLPQSVGVAGGRPSASHYFVGAQGSHFFYLDPHSTRPALPPRDIGDTYTQEEIDTYHTRRLRRIHLKDMDPSMLIGFLIRNEEDWNDWKNRVALLEAKPVIHILTQSDSRFPQGRKEALDEVEALDDVE